MLDIKTLIVIGGLSLLCTVGCSSSKAPASEATPSKAPTPAAQPATKPTAKATTKTPAATWLRYGRCAQVVAPKSSPTKRERVTLSAGSVQQLLTVWPGHWFCPVVTQHLRPGAKPPMKLRSVLELKLTPLQKVAMTAAKPMAGFTVVYTWDKDFIDRLGQALEDLRKLKGAKRRALCGKLRSWSPDAAAMKALALKRLASMLAGKEPPAQRTSPDNMRGYLEAIHKSCGPRR